MRIPLLQSCICGHLGQQHRPDGTCPCGCPRFTRPSLQRPDWNGNRGRVRTMRAGPAHPSRDAR